MRHLVFVVINSILLCSICINSVIVKAQTTEEWDVCALSKKERIEEIISNVIGKYKEDDNITRNEALICINQVAGLSDNAVIKASVLLNYSDLYLYKDRLYRLCLLSQYNFYTYEKTLFLEETTNGFFGNYGYCFYPTNNCTIGYAIELMANCIDKDYNDPIDVAKTFNLCSADMLEKIDKNITVFELKVLMDNMFDVAGEIYYNSDECGVTDNEFVTNNDISYYERYCNKKTYFPDVITIDGKNQVEAIKNKNGVYLVKLRSFLNSYNKNIEWENGTIVIKDDTSIIKLSLDNFPGKIRMFTSASIYAEHPVYEDEFVVRDESYTYLGEYEMINDHVYLYPYTLFEIIDYLELDVSKNFIP